MKKIKYKSQSEKNYILRIVALLILIFIFFLAANLLSNYNKNSSLESIDTIKAVIEYYKSEYISEKESDNKDFDLEVFLKFKVLPYDQDNNSNEEYYNNLIEACAKVIYYKNFILNDKYNDIVIKITCSNGKIDKIIINDIEDYFIYMDSKISLEKYKEIEMTEVTIETQLLKDCIENNWKQKSVDFGSRESIFNNYYIFFDEGIRVRSISGKIFNVIFDRNYKESIINGIALGTDFEVIKKRLGKPAFEDEGLNLIGYKCSDFYIFFGLDEVSVYRNTEEETDDFFKLADKFTAEKIGLLDFMNELTYIWPDYSDYEYDSNYVFISYPTKGIEIKINYDDINGILVYNNIKASLPKIGYYLGNTYFVSRLQLDLIFINEKRRINEENSFMQNCTEYKTSLNENELGIIGENMKYDIYPLKDNNGYIFSMRFISKNGDGPNREINDGINDYLWYGDYFIYSKRNVGIFIVDINTGIVKVLQSGKSEFRLNEIENDILKYDNKELVIQY